ncbi:MAG: PSD1 and planctomycete cytochrome C domain-containing protein [Pirellulales bacterium]
MVVRLSIFAGLLPCFTLAQGGLLAETTSAQMSPAEAIEHFELHVRPVLATVCGRCHGSQQASGGLRVDSRAAILNGGDHGPAVVPGRPDDSLLIQAIRRTHDEVVMPPDEELPADAIDHIARWIDRGAPWLAPHGTIADPFAAAGHWAFQPLAPVELPEDSDPSLSSIDRFIRARLHDEQLTSVDRATPEVLLRRAYFDLIGLPPTPAEIDNFLSDTATDAWPRLIERLLASPHYGERWGRHWLDVVRYADTAGDNADYPVPEARLYRDYVLDAFQHDKPFDQFIREQLGGDILAANPSTDDARRHEQIIATGYLALARRYATAPYELWHLTLEDAIDTTGRAFLGLSLRCARCHDHKYDPVTQADYYALYGIFDSTQFAWAGGEEFASKKLPRQHFTALARADEVASRTADLDATIAQCQADFDMAEAASDKQLAKRLRQQLDSSHLQQQYGLPPDIPAAYAVHEGTPGDAHIHERGDPDSPGPVVPRGVPKFIAGPNPPYIPPQASGRLELANWLTSPANPLTSRVIVNRVWQWHFGRGLVATPSDFGLRGTAPTNRELLDWLASRLIASGWSIKSLHRDIMLSETYQLASRPSSLEHADSAAHDPDNFYHWRFNRRRLDAESLRDALLVASGQFDPRRPGPHPFPPVSEWRWTQHAPFQAVYDSPHRSVYLMTQRLARHPYLALFDGPDPNTSTGIRTSSIVPSQALYLLNNPFVTVQARKLADRLISFSPDATTRIEFACQTCWSRRPTSDEVQQARDYLTSLNQAFQQSNLSPAQLESEVWNSYARVLFASHEFIYVD